MNLPSILTRVRLALLDYPLLLREVQTRMRGAKTFLIVFVYDLLLIAFMGLVYVETTRHSGWQYGSVELGRTIFSFLSYAQLILMLLIAPATSSGSITTERERRSLDVMAISLLTPREIVWGKLMASTCFALILLISSVPLIAMCFMFGGVDPLDVLENLTLIVVSIVSFSSMALFFSAVCKRTVVAVVVTFVGVLTLTAGMPGLLWLLTSMAHWDEGNVFFACTLFSSPFAMLTVVLPHELQNVPAKEDVWGIHSLLHAALSFVWLALAAKFVAYPRAKE